LLAAAALFLFFPGLLGLLTDWWWFQEIGYQIVFTRTLTTRVLLFLLAGGLAAGLLYLNLRIAQRGLVANPILLQVADSAPRLNLTAALRRLSTPVALGVGLLSGLAGAASWDLFLPALYRTPFGIADPVFSRDIGFYVFTLPALSAALGFLVTLTILSLLAVTLIYGVRGDLAPQPRQLRVEPSAGLHLAILLAVVLVLFGSSRLPQLARSLGSAKNEFERGLRDDAADPEE
jgi:TatA/E family protein of Tat protein translocase